MAGLSLLALAAVSVPLIAAGLTRLSAPTTAPAADQTLPPAGRRRSGQAARHRRAAHAASGRGGRRRGTRWRASAAVTERTGPAVLRRPPGFRVGFSRLYFGGGTGVSGPARSFPWPPMFV